MESTNNMTGASFLRPGERLAFRLGWGILSHAGTTTIETDPAVTPGQPVRVRVRTASRGMVEAIYPLQNDSSSFIDAVTGRPVRIEITGRDGRRETRSTTVFDYEAGKIIHTDEVRPNRSGTAELSDQSVYDIMVTMLNVRTWNLAPGESRMVKVAFADDIYDIEVKVVGEERIRTPAGRFDAVEIEAIQHGELKGFFRKGGSMRFWISKGELPQIVRMDFRTKVGTISSVLVETGQVAVSGHEDTRP